MVKCEECGRDGEAYAWKAKNSLAGQWIDLCPEHLAEQRADLEGTEYEIVDVPKSSPESKAASDAVWKLRDALSALDEVRTEWADEMREVIERAISEVKEINGRR